MYLGPIVSLLSGPNMIVPRATISKIIPQAELGKVNSFMGSLEAVVPLLASPLYNGVYTSTLEILPGAFFVLSALFLLPPMLIYWWFWTTEKEPSKKKD
jgi:PCFT/HCP family folate transporter-like MFS transporter 1/3